VILDGMAPQPQTRFTKAAPATIFRGLFGPERNTEIMRSEATVEIAKIEKRGGVGETLNVALFVPREFGRAIGRQKW
jgi:hypothetical protein